MSLEDLKLTSATDINNISTEDFEGLTPEKIRAAAAAESSTNTDDQSDKDGEEDPDDLPENNDDEEGQGSDENNPDHQEEEEEEDQESEDNSDVDPEQNTQKLPEAKPNTPEPKAKEKKQDPAVEVNHEGFYQALTAPLKAAGQEFTFTDPEQIRKLASQGIDYTRKMQQISHLRGIGEILRENDLLDPQKLAFAIDLVNKKPEAIARLIQDSELDSFELDEEKANTYQSVPVDISGKSKAVELKEIIDGYKDNANFNAMFEEARTTWDEASQIDLVQNPQFLHLLAEHTANGVYSKVMDEVKRQRILGQTSEPILRHYNRIGLAMYGESNQGGGEAQARPNTQPQQNTKQRVVIKRNSVDDASRRKSLAPNASSKTVKGKTVNSAADIFNLSQEEFNKLDPAVLRKFT